MKAKKRMTKTEFYKLLPKKGWKVNGELIRRNGVCPICAVANRLLHKRKFTDQEIGASAAIGLPLGITQGIVSAADDSWAKDRTKLLKACGIELKVGVNC